MKLIISEPIPMPKHSAGILLYRIRNNIPEFFLVHPGGPFWAKKDLRSWSVPKGEVEDGEDYAAAALREFREETGFSPACDPVPLSAIIQKGGKVVHCFACEGEIDPSKIESNTFEIEWPPRSGKKQSFPEIDRAAWFTAGTAKEKIIEAQSSLIDETLSKILKAGD